MCIACEWAEQASLLEKWRESRALRDLKDDAPPAESEPVSPSQGDETPDN